MWDELVHAVMEQWSHGAQQFFGDVGAAKIWAFAIPLLPAIYGVWIKWRNTGYRQLDRLHEFLDKQDRRLDGARKKLIDAAVIPPAHSPYETPIFVDRVLNRSLRNLGWGFGTASVGNLAEASQLSADQATLSERQSTDHRKRQALAHLMLGAKAAAQTSKNSATRISYLRTALDEFQKALNLDRMDAEALQYSGLVLLQLGRPDEAAERFKTLIEVRHRSGGGKPLAEAHRLRATAFENWHKDSKLFAASGELTKAINAMPPGLTFELALLHEHQGWVRLKMGAQSAKASFDTAAFLFGKVDTKEGKAGELRVVDALSVLREGEKQSTRKTTS